jgi:plastocyanin
VAALLVALATVLLAAAPLPGLAVHTVIIEGMSFSPQTLTVRRGDRVTWINKDPFPHTVTATDGKFDSHPIAPDGSWTYVARKPGEYDYVCTLHVTMKGRLLVR